jgi:hypothetical protein
MEYLSQKDLCAEGGWLPWRISLNTFRKERKRWKIKAANVDGIRPVFDPAEIEKKKKLRLETLLAKHN